ncbi:hypothetical protein [Rhodococcus ruber]|uniref:hypothetical protein n=1 Tax=Rhodococcus ruber TaxID=1830 RepID=UPI003D8193C5
MTAVVVGTRDLRAALTSVRAHAATHPDLERLRRIRLEIDTHHVTVTATDTFSAGLAIVSIWEDEDRQDVTVDLTPEQVDKILKIFPTPKDKGDQPSAILRLEVGDNYFELTDVSGLPGIDGQSLRQPRLATDESYPDIPHLISRTRSGELKWLEQFAVNGDRLAAFRIAGVVYSEPVVIEARTGTRALAITVGESFLGVLMPVALDEDAQVRLKEWNEGWEARLPHPDSLSRNAERISAEGGDAP